MKKLLKAFGLLIFLLLISDLKISSYASDTTDAHRSTMRVGFFESPGFNEITESGIYAGYGYEITESINQLTDWEVEYVGYDKSIDDLYEMLKDGEIDFITGVNYSKDIKRSFLSSDLDIGSASFFITARTDDKRFDKPVSDWPEVVVGYYFYNDLIRQFMEFAKANNLKYSFKQFSYTEDNNYLDNESIDIFISSGYRLVDFNKEKIVNTFGEEFKYIITRQDDTELLNEINEALDTLLKYDPDIFSKLRKKYYRLEDSSSLKLTIEEHEFVNDHKDDIIKAAVFKELKPFYYYKNNKFEGILPKYLNLINKASGLNIELVSYDNYEDYISAIHSGEVSICADFISVYSLAETYEVRLTQPYLANLKISYISKPDKRFYNDKVSIYNPLNYKYYELNPNLKNMEIESYDSVDETLRSIILNKADFAYIPTYCARAYLDSYEFSKLQYSENDWESVSYCFAVTDKNNKVLADIISKSIYFVGDAVLQEMLVDEFGNNLSQISFWDYLKLNLWILWIVGVVLFFVVIIIIILSIRTYKNRQEAKLIRHTTEQYNAILATNIMALEITNIESNVQFYSYSISDNAESNVIREQKTPADLKILIDKIHPDDIVHVKDIFSSENFVDIFRSNKNIYKEIRVAYKENDRNYYYIGISISYIDSVSDKRILMLFKDIDSAKKDEEEKRYTLQMALDTARSYGNFRNTFLSQITHDLRTPMNAIMGMTTIAQLNLDNKDKVEECLDTISNSSTHLIALLNDILDVTRIETGRFSFNQKRIRIKNVLKNSVEMLSKRARDNNIELIVDDSSVIHDHIISDENRLEQVFGNLISNAIKYSDKNNKVEITLRETTKPTDNEFYYEFIVKDHGIGMSEETLSTLYTPFERGEEAKFAEGTGLGMTITKSIIEAMGGIITVSSKLNEGTTFTINLSFTDDTTNSLANVSLVAGKNALIISEDAGVRDLLSAILEEGNMICDSMDQFEISDIFMEKEFLIILTYFKDDLDSTGKKLIDLRNIVGKDTIICNVTEGDANIASGLKNEFRVDGFVSLLYCKQELIRLISDVIDSKKLSKKIKIESTLTGKRVLIVEDVEINAIFAKAISEMKGLTTEIATNGKEALEMLEKCNDGYYDIIFMDLHMPVMDGFKTVSIIRNSGRQYLSKIPIIAMSANTFPEDIIKCKKVGMDDYISKPIDINVFNEITDKYLI